MKLLRNSIQHFHPALVLLALFNIGSVVYIVLPTFAPTAKVNSVLVSTVYANNTASHSPHSNVIATNLEIGQSTTTPPTSSNTQSNNTPTTDPTPTTQPSAAPSPSPDLTTTPQPSTAPTTQPSVQPSTQPSVAPTTQPTTQPTVQPTAQPTARPSGAPSPQPTTQPTPILTPTPIPLVVISPTTAPTPTPTPPPAGVGGTNTNQPPQSFTNEHEFNPPQPINYDALSSDQTPMTTSPAVEPREPDDIPIPAPSQTIAQKVRSIIIPDSLSTQLPNSSFTYKKSVSPKVTVAISTIALNLVAVAGYLVRPIKILSFNL